MIPLYSTKIIRKVDEYAINRLGFPGIVLMENASLEVFRIASEELKLSTSKRIGFICGKGNNGGDGFALARHFLVNGYKVLVVQLFNENEMTHDCRANFVILTNLFKRDKQSRIIKFRFLNDIPRLNKCDLIVDAMLGSGIEGDLREPYNSIVNKVNNVKCLKLSIDISTGLNADSGYSKLLFHSDLTVTLGELKPGLFIGDGYAFSGKVKKGRIGINDSFYPEKEVTEYLIEAQDVITSLPQKAKSVHKYSAGKVLTEAGSGKYPGAAILTAKSCLKVGAGASILAFPKSIRSFVHKNLAEVVLKDYEDNDYEFLRKENLKDSSERIKWADVVALGPGLGRSEETQSAVISLLKEKIRKETNKIFTTRY